jgi:hypothetical protein
MNRFLNDFLWIAGILLVIGGIALNAYECIKHFDDVQTLHTQLIMYWKGTTSMILGFACLVAANDWR